MEVVLVACYTPTSIYPFHLQLIYAMATASLIKNFQNLGVTDDVDADQPDLTCLPFNPGEGFKSARERLGRVDRYLFRLFDKHSEGSTDSHWVKSKDAQHSRPTSKTDIFARADRKVAVQALRRHLQWNGQPGDEDNFVSWTSSLLLVLQYAFYRSQHFKDIDFAETSICVVDTSRLPDGVFLSDMALMDSFSRHDTTTGKSLPALKKLRQRKYYFGEYLSQGALKIEGCCSIVSMQQIIHDGLGYLRPEFGTAEAFNGEWANKVVALREAFYNSEPSWLTEDREIDAAIRIGNRYGASWEIPIALAFLALKPRRVGDGRQDEKIIRAFRKLYDRGKPALPALSLS